MSLFLPLVKRIHFSGYFFQMSENMIRVFCEILSGVFRFICRITVPYCAISMEFLPRVKVLKSLRIQKTNPPPAFALNFPFRYGLSSTEMRAEGLRVCFNIPCDILSAIRTLKKESIVYR